MEGNHGETLPRTIPQEQDAQGKANEDPKESQVNQLCLRRFSNLLFCYGKYVDAPKLKKTNYTISFERQNWFCKYFLRPFQ